MPILCLGEALVDLICEREVDSPAVADCYRRHSGGALANVAVAARRMGVDAALAGGVGDDEFGAWLAGRLASEGVDLRWFSLVPQLRTGLAVATSGADREPHFQIYSEDLEATLLSVNVRLSAALGESSALAFGSNTLVGDGELALTRRAREEAIELGLPVLFDPNLRRARWEDLEIGYHIPEGEARKAIVFAGRGAAGDQVFDAAAVRKMIADFGFRNAD